MTYLQHHGIDGQEWGVRNGHRIRWIDPIYPQKSEELWFEKLEK